MKFKKEPLDVDITSLLDILVILLVFLLRSYNATDLKLEVAKNIELPNSKSEDLGSHAIIIQLNQKDEIYINQKMIGTFSISDGKILSLFSQLITMKAETPEAYSKARSPAQQDSPTPRKVNLVFHKELTYDKIQAVLHTATLAGYSKFKFIVQGNGG